MFGPFSIDTLFPAFPAVAADLGAGPVAMQQTISVYLIAYALMSLAHGPLSDALGRRSVILAGVALFTLASIGCALAGSIESLLAFRALQGVSAGAGMIVGRAIVRDCFDGADAQRLMASISMIFGIAPAIAPIVGGWVIAFARWPMIFWLLAAFSLVLWFVCLAWLPETHPRERRTPLSMAELVRSYRMILTDRMFVPLSLSGTLGFGALFVYIASAPAFVLGLLQLDEQSFAWLFVPAIGGMMTGSLLSGRLAGRLSPLATVRLGFAIMLAASVVNIAFAWLLPRPMLPWSVLPIALQGVGVALNFPTLALLLLDRYPHHRGAASSMQAFVNLLVSALIAGGLSALLSDSILKLALAAGAFSLAGAAVWWLRPRQPTERSA